MVSAYADLLSALRKVDKAHYFDVHILDIQTLLEELLLAHNSHTAFQD